MPGKAPKLVDDLGVAISRIVFGGHKTPLILVLILLLPIALNIFSNQLSTGLAGTNCRPLAHLWHVWPSPGCGALDSRTGSSRYAPYDTAGREPSRLQSPHPFSQSPAERQRQHFRLESRRCTAGNNPRISYVREIRRPLAYDLRSHTAPLYSLDGGHSASFE